MRSSSAWFPSMVSVSSSRRDLGLISASSHNRRLWKSSNCRSENGLKRERRGGNDTHYSTLMGPSWVWNITPNNDQSASLALFPFPVFWVWWNCYANKRNFTHLLWTQFLIIKQQSSFSAEPAASLQEKWKKNTKRKGHHLHHLENWTKQMQMWTMQERRIKSEEQHH